MNSSWVEESEGTELGFLCTVLRCVRVLTRPRIIPRMKWFRVRPIRDREYQVNEK